MYREEIAAISNEQKLRLDFLKKTLVDILLCHYSEVYT